MNKDRIRIKDDHLSFPPFLSINQAVKATGISSYSLRRGCKDGTIPHIKVGDKYLINYHKLLERDDSSPQDCTA